jgi:hypothetical protein
MVFAATFFGFFLAIPVILRTQPFNDPGALWHIRVGDWILEHQAFPRTDPFTWSYAGRPWIPQQWGAEIVMSVAHLLGGFDALLMGMSALLALVAAMVVVRFVDAGLHWAPALGIVALGMATASFHFYVRPHLASIALLAIVMMWIVDFERGRIGAKRLVWLIPLCIAWTNLHGGVLGGIFTFGLAIGGWAIFGTRPINQLLYPALILFACALATLVNPFGLDMHRTWWSIVGSSTLKEHISEHQPLSLARSDGQAIVAFGFFYLLMLAGMIPKRPRASWLIPIAWLGLSFTSIRHGPLFCAVALVAMADLLPETYWFRLLKRYGNTFARERAPTSTRLGWRGGAIPVLAMLVALILETTRVPVPVIGYGWAKFDPKMVPVDMIEPLRAYAASRPNGYPIFNDANLGGFVIYFAPSLKVFMDDRFELYGDDEFKNYVEMVNRFPERIEDWAQHEPFDRALVSCDTEKEPSEMDRYLKSHHYRWHEVMRGERAVLYERLR